MSRCSKPAPQVLARRLPGGAVLVHLESNRIFELNETGAHVWCLLADGLDREQILKRLVDEYEVDLSTGAIHLDSLLEQLSREGLLSPS